MINAPDEKPKITWPLLRRVLHYAKPYRWQIMAMLLLILVQSGVGLLTPLIMRDMIDVTIPAGNLNRLITLASGAAIFLISSKERSALYSWMKPSMALIMTIVIMVRASAISPITPDMTVAPNKTNTMVSVN